MLIRKRCVLLELDGDKKTPHLHGELTFWTYVTFAVIDSFHLHVTVTHSDSFHPSVTVM